MFELSVERETLLLFLSRGSFNRKSYIVRDICYLLRYPFVRIRIIEYSLQ